MVSRFESTFRDRVVPAAERAFGVDVDFIFSDDTELRLTALVDIEDIPQGDDRYTRVNGTLTIQTATLAANRSETDVLLSVRVRDELFHVVSKSPSHCGLTVFNIRRQASEQDHSNMFDMNDQQAVWHTSEDE